MNIYLYDFFNSRIAGKRWFVGDGVPVKVPMWLREIPEELNEIFPNIQCNNWRSDDFIGGIKALDSALCVFRIFNGGLDFRGRSNRWVMLAVVVERNEFCATNLWEALNCDVFCSYAQKVVPENAILPELFPTWKVHSPIENPTIPQNETCVGSDAKAFVEKSSLALTSSVHVNGRVLVETIGENVRAWVNSTDGLPCSRKTILTPKPSSEILKAKEEILNSDLKHLRITQTKGNDKTLYRKFASLGLLVIICGAVCALVVKCSLSFFASTETRFSVCKKTNEVLVCRNFLKNEEKSVRAVCPQCGESHQWRRINEIKEVNPPTIVNEEANDATTPSSIEKKGES